MSNKKKRLKKLIKERHPGIKCEVCEESNHNVLHLHHIIERTELNTSNDDLNFGILCSNCHSLVHSNQIHIIGVFPSTKPPAYRTLVYIGQNGRCNIPGMENAEPYFKPEPKKTKLRR